MTKLVVGKWLMFMAAACIMTIPSNAQPSSLTPEEHEQLDLLMYNVDLEQLSEVLERKEEHLRSTNVKILSAYHQQIDGYVRVLETVASVTGQEGGYIKNYVMQRMGQQEQYEPMQVGHHAAELYDAFARLVQGRAYTEAVGYYEASRYFKTKYLLLIEQRLAAHYDRALAAYEARAYKRVRSTVDSVSIYFGSKNVLHQLLIDKLKVLRADARQVIKEEERQERAWAQTERPTFKAGITLGGQVVSRSPVGPLTLQLSDPQSGQTVLNIDRSFERAFQLSYGLRVYGFLSSRWTLGGGFDYTSYNFPSDIEQDLFFFDINVESQTAYAFARYMLRPEVGMRPYLLAGYGVVKTS